MVFTHNIYPFCQALGRLANGFIMHKIAAESRIKYVLKVLLFGSAVNAVFPFPIPPKYLHMAHISCVELPLVTLPAFCLKIEIFFMHLPKFRFLLLEKFMNAIFFFFIAPFCLALFIFSTLCGCFSGFIFALVCSAGFLFALIDQTLDRPAHMVCIVYGIYIYLYVPTLAQDRDPGGEGRWLCKYPAAVAFIHMRAYCTPSIGRGCEEVLSGFCDLLFMCAIWATWTSTYEYYYGNGATHMGLGPCFGCKAPRGA